MANVDDLDAKAFEVLEAVYESGGEANTSEIKEYTGIQKNAIIHYRYDRLEEAGLITTRTGESTGARVPPKVAVLTDEAQEQIAGGLFDTDDSTIVERMDRLERQFGALVDEFRDVEREFRNWRYDEESDEEVDLTEVLDNVRGLQEEVETYREAIDMEVVEELNWDESYLIGHMRDRFRELDSWEEEIEERLGEIESGGHGRDDLDVDQLRARLDQAEQEADEARAEADDLRNEVQELRTERTQMKNRLDALEKQQEGGESGGFWSLFR